MPNSVGELLPVLRARYGEARVQRHLEAIERLGATVEDSALWLRAAVAHDFRFMPMELVPRCPCGSDDTRLLCRFIFWNLLAARQCQSCGLIFASPRLTAEAMKTIFNDFYFDTADLAYWGTRREWIFEDIGRLLRLYRVRRVFDVGTGFGHFVKWATRHGFQAEGSDISATAVSAGRRHLGVPLYCGALQELPLPAGRVDAVVSLDALYYVRDPVAELRAMRRLVRPGGYLILRLRNGFWTRLYATCQWGRAIGRSIMPDGHLWAFTPRTITGLLASAGWAVGSVESAVYSYSSMWPVHAALVAAHRRLPHAHGHPPILTRSFNVVARAIG